MILPFISIEGLAAQAYDAQGEGTDRDSFLLGFVSGVEAMGQIWREQLEKRQKT